MKEIMSQIDINLGKKLRALRYITGKSQRDIGEIIGVSFQQIQKLEKGYNRISAANLYRICKEFGRPMSWFFEVPIEEIEQQNIAFNRAISNIKNEEVKRRLLSLAATLGKGEVEDANANVS